MHFAGFHMEKRDKHKTDAEFTDDVMYYVWRRGGNPDRVQQEKVARMRQEDNGEFADDVADRMIANEK